MNKTCIDHNPECCHHPDRGTHTSAPGHTIIVQFARGLLAGAEQSSLSPSALLESIGIGPEMQSSPMARIPLDDVSTLLLRLSHVLRDEGLALFERPLRAGTLALITRQMVCCTTLGEALQTATALCRTLIDDFRIRLAEANGYARLVLVHRRDNAMLVPAHTVFLYCLVSVCSWLIQKPIHLSDFTVAHSGFGAFGKPGTRLLNVPVRFGQTHSSIEFDLGYLSAPVLPDDEAAENFLRRAPASLLLPFRAQSSLAEQVRQRLRRHLGEEWPSLDTMANALHVSPQKLRRSLHDQGSGYQHIKNELRRDMAIEYLLRSDLNLSDIGERLGFTEPSAFQRAFKRWTGVAPGEYRGERRSIDSSTIRSMFSAPPLAR